MKFKVAVIGLLSAILVVCLFTAYTLIDRANRQFELQRLNTMIAIESYEVDNHVRVENAEISQITVNQYKEFFNEICGTD